MEKEEIRKDFSDEIKKEWNVKSSLKEYLIWVIVGGLGFGIPLNMTMLSEPQSERVTWGH